MEQLYNKFVETWNTEFPKEDPPLLDLHGCILTTNDGFESVNKARLGKLYNEARETSKRLRREYRKAELIENFWATLMKDCNGFESPEYSPRSSIKENCSPSSKVTDKKNSGENAVRKYSLLEGLGKCVDSSLETFVNVGMGGDVIDVTPNHEIQVNAVVGGDQCLIKDNKVSDGVSGENLETEVLDKHVRDSGSLPNIGFCNDPHSRDNNPYVNASIVNDERRKVSSDNDDDEGVDYENQSLKKPSVSVGHVPSIKPAIPPRRPKFEHQGRPKPPTVPRSKKNHSDSSLKNPQRSTGEPVKVKINIGKQDYLEHVRQCTPETNLDELTGNNSFDNSEVTSFCHAGIAQCSEEANKDMLRNKFRLSDGGKEKQSSGEVISTGFKPLSNESDDFSPIITKSSQKSTPETPSSSSSGKKRLRSRSNDYENFSVDFLLRRTPVFDLEEDDDRDSHNSGVYDNNFAGLVHKSSDSDASSADTASNTSLTSGEVCNSKASASDSPRKEDSKREGNEKNRTQSSDKCKY